MKLPRTLALLIAALATVASLGACGEEDAGRVAVTLRVAVPRTTPDDAQVFLQRAGEGANPADPELELQPAHPKVYAISLDLESG